MLAILSCSVTEPRFILIEVRQDDDLLYLHGRIRQTRGPTLLRVPPPMGGPLAQAIHDHRRGEGWGGLMKRYFY